MAYNTTRENLAHLRRIVTGLADFKGRSGRTEFLVFLILMMVITGVASFLSEVTTHGSVVEYGQYLQLAFWVFAIPLFARRLHDQNRSGWFALIVPAMLGLKLYGQILFDARQLPIPELGYPFNVVEFILVVAFWTLIVWPGTEGENRFGQDPRLAPAAAP